MPTFVVVVAERRTYEIEADSGPAAIDRVLDDPEELPIGSLVSVVRGDPKIVRTESQESSEENVPDASGPSSPITDLDQARLNQPWR